MTREVYNVLSWSLWLTQTLMGSCGMFFLIFAYKGAPVGIYGYRFLCMAIITFLAVRHE